MPGTSRYIARLRFTCLAACILLAGTATRASAAIVFDGDVSPADRSGWSSSADGYIAKTANLTGSAIVDAGSILSSRYGYLGYAPNSVGTATVTGGGSKWANTYELHIGYAGTGTLNIEDGGEVSSVGGTLGNHGGVPIVFAGAGTVTVSGAGSKWTNSGNLSVGSYGTGTLNILAGGQVSNAVAYLGYNIESTGTATVTGPGSKWINSGGLFVGVTGRGTLTVADGGAVTAQTLYASLSDLSGNGTITTTKGAVLDADLAFAGSLGSQAVVAFGSGGTLTVNLDSSSVFGVGYKGSGILSMTGGATVASSTGYLGYNYGSSGAATVSGTGSKWTNTGDLRVGYYGSGELNIVAGGQVSSTNAYLGDRFNSSGTATVSGSGSTWTVSKDIYVGYPGSSGTLAIAAGGQISSANGHLFDFPDFPSAATVTGPGSKWTNSGDLFVGSSSNGTLTVTDGGTVTTGMLYGSVSGLLGDGTITATQGAVLDADLVFDGSTGPQTTVAFGTGGTLIVNTGSGSLLGAGYSGTGSLQILGGATITTSSGYLGYNSGSTGTATVSGAGSKWTTGSLWVGNGGRGELRIEAEGQVKSYTGHVGESSIGTSTATVSGVGSKWTNDDYLYVGRYRNGALRIEAGAEVSDKSGYLGSSAGSAGTATVTGIGSKWTHVNYFYVGDSGSGTLSVSAGGQITDQTGYLGKSAGSTGTATVSGAGSKWTNSSELYVGYSGSGTLLIEAGAEVTDRSGYLGGPFSDSTSTGMGAATVSGAGSKWTNTGTLYVGFSGSGILTVADGGTVTATTLYASQANLFGDGTISTNGAVLDADLVFDGAHDAQTTVSFGSGGTLNVSPSGNVPLGVGYKDAGTLRIADGVTVACSYGFLGYSAGSSGHGYRNWLKVGHQR